MAYCLTTPNHYLNWCWCLNSELLWYSPESNFIASASGTIQHDEFKNVLLELLWYLKGDNPGDNETPPISVSKTRGGDLSVVNILQNIDYVMMGPNCINMLCHLLLLYTSVIYWNMVHLESFSSSNNSAKLGTWAWLFIHGGTARIFNNCDLLVQIQIVQLYIYKFMNNHD